MKHEFSSHSTKQLLDLKTLMRGTLKNPRCAILNLPVLNTIKQIDVELAGRGLRPLNFDCVMKISATI